MDKHINIFIILIIIIIFLKIFKTFEYFTKTKKKKIAIITCVWKRYDLTKIVLEYLKYTQNVLRNDLDIEIVIVGSEGDLYRKLCEQLNFHYVEKPNKPLNKKFNAASKYCEKIQPDEVLLIGSDDIITPNTIIELSNRMNEDNDIVGLTNLYFMDLKDFNIHKWNGYTGSIYKKGTTIGTGRLYSKKVLEAVDWYLWDNDHDINIALDGNSHRRIKKFGFNFKGYSLEELNGFAMDVKGTGVNLGNIKHYNNMERKLNKDDTQNLLKEYLNTKVIIDLIELHTKIKK
jgi:hypothetical protein